MSEKLSVVMAARNGSGYIREQLDSILCQIGPEDEVIISLDPSTDNTEEIIKSRKDPRIILIKGPGKGLIRNFEHALKKASGDIIFLADQDDVWNDSKVKTCLKTLSSEKALLLVHDCQITDEHLNTVEGSYFTARHSRPGFVQNLIRNSFIGCCMVFRKELLDSALPFPDKIPMHDQWLGLLACRKGNVVFLKEPLLKYRRHGDNNSSLKHSSVKEMLVWRWQLLKALMTEKNR